MAWEAKNTSAVLGGVDKSVHHVCMAPHPTTTRLGLLGVVLGPQTYEQEVIKVWDQMGKDSKSYPKKMLIWGQSWWPSRATSF